MVPHLITALTGPINELEQRILESLPAIERWFRLEWMEHTPPFYTAVDVRNAGFKLAPVDTNLFPGGFNNLNDAFMPLCVQAAQAAIERICAGAGSILLIPENHTRNQFYLQNVAKLVSILRLTGLEVRLGSLLPEITAPTVVELANGSSLTLEPLERHGSRLGLKDFNPCAVLLNNDLSAGPPAILQDLDQLVAPMLVMSSGIGRILYPLVWPHMRNVPEIVPALWMNRTASVSCASVRFAEPQVRT